MKKSSLRNLRFILIAIIAILFAVSVYAQEDALKKIKEIDSKMYQGSIKYLLINYADRELFDENIIIYNTINYNINNCAAKQYDITLSEELKKKLKRKQKSNLYNTAASNYYTGGSSIFYQDKSVSCAGPDPMFFGIISNGPSSGYGRGLSILKDAKYDPAKKEVSGFVFETNKKNKYYIVAKVEPELGYLASKIYCYSTYERKLLKVMENSDPILVDNKYYIYRNSIIMGNEGNIHTFKVISITFNEPSKVGIPNNEEKVNIPVKKYWKTINLISKEQYREIVINFLPKQQGFINVTNKDIEFYNPLKDFYTSAVDKVTSWIDYFFA